MSIVDEVLLKLPDGQDVWRVTFVRYRDAESGKFISEEEVDDPGMRTGPITSLELDSIEKRIMTTLMQIADDPDRAAASISSMRMLLRQVEKMKKEKVESQNEEE